MHAALSAALAAGGGGRGETPPAVSHGLALGRGVDELMSSSRGMGRPPLPSPPERRGSPPPPQLRMKRTLAETWLLACRGLNPLTKSREIVLGKAAGSGYALCRTVSPQQQLLCAGPVGSGPWWHVNVIMAAVLKQIMDPCPLSMA